MKKIILTLVILTIPCLIIAKKSSQLVFKEVATMIPTNSTFYKPDSAMVWKIESITPMTTSSNKTVYLRFNQGPEIPFQRSTPLDGPLWINHTGLHQF